jgi:hypothetical protein
MENMVDLLLNAENVRMMLLLVFGYCGYVMLRSQMKGLEYSLSKRMDGLDKKIDDVEASLLKTMDEKMDLKLAAFYAQLKANDFAHLNNTIEALTFMLEKNKFLEKEDKEYIDRRLDR